MKDHTRRWLLFALLLGAMRADAADAAVNVTRLQCEYRENPEGIGETRPRLSFMLSADADARGVKQTAYQILVASSAAKLIKNRGDLWDSGRVKSDRMHQIEYDGRPLAARQRCHWKARVWDETGRPSEWSAPARFSVGLLVESDWQAQWIGLDAPQPSGSAALDEAARTRLAAQPWIYADVPPSKTAPITVYVRGAFRVAPGVRVTRAKIALTADQAAEVRVNGKLLGTVTRWEQIAPIDIARWLEPGENIVALAVTQRDGHPPAVLGEIQIQYEDGAQQIVPIDPSWIFSPEAGDGWEWRGFDTRGWKAMIAPPGKRNPWDGPPQTLIYFLPPAPMLRKTFMISKAVRRATVYSTALGAYELQLNGARVGQD
ncbi:MAG: alpha-L-rhamnosidase N-terminal domain-containing protein, partial [Vicinamibacteria bacterium]|nr:alpha-L-rhamnosidase N-terminal domain-containing protein [Vicinamibacteria bacterium]